MEYQSQSVSASSAQNGTGGSCGYKKGSLPECAPLAAAFVPMQCAASPAYDPDDALKRGTLFPGLDLPFMNVVNTRAVEGPLAEVMALCFVCHELHLYLDTHPEDGEAFALLQKMLALADEAKRRYTAKYGPLCPADLARSKSFDWLECPWPWVYQD